MTRVWAASNSLESAEDSTVESEVSRASTSEKRELRGDPGPLVEYGGEEKGRFIVFGQLPLNKNNNHLYV